MSKHSYFTFSLGDRLYGVNIIHVEETFSLPEIVLIPDASQNLIGMVDLRGEMLPILDLTSRAGSRLSNYHLTDSIVILRQAEIRVGIIVNQVHGVTEIAAEEVSTNFSQEQLSLTIEQFMIAGITLSEELCILKAPEEWIDFSAIQQALIEADWFNNKGNNGDRADELEADESQALVKQSLDFYPEASLQERAVLRDRSNRLKQRIDSKQAEELTPLAVITVSSQLFGFDLKSIKEFIEVSQVIPIPCSPSYFVGNVNLRGEILTLIDLRSLLNLPLKPFAIPSKIMVIEIDSVIAGVVIDDIRDALFLIDLRALKKGVKPVDSIPNSYLQGSVPYQDRSLYILNLQSLFVKELVTP
ncbi:MAG: chemotaxis protein CheW [Oscillatoriophycideae cyanobacterium NC_groundwater_1537_Pr4_S-0.65um_50_18]|nr:chemotaxis protein CheW [Oscillatoriophycideae cyanobacterium NC_groundwater_1537_Pr4_S-0.65um_50_18]